MPLAEAAVFDDDDDDDEVEEEEEAETVGVTAVLCLVGFLLESFGFLLTGSFSSVATSVGVAPAGLTCSVDTGAASGEDVSRGNNGRYNQ